MHSDVSDRLTGSADVVAEIKASCPPDAHDFATAEGRRDFDNLLRAALARIGDPALRSNAAEMIREWRARLYRLPGSDIADRLEVAEASIAALRVDLDQLCEVIREQHGLLLDLIAARGGRETVRVGCGTTIVRTD